VTSAASVALSHAAPARLYHVIAVDVRMSWTLGMQTSPSVRDALRTTTHRLGGVDVVATDQVQVLQRRVEARAQDFETCRSNAMTVITTPSSGGRQLLELVGASVEPAAVSANDTDWWSTVVASPAVGRSTTEQSGRSMCRVRQEREG
jgi:hypothetical protein